MVKCGLKKCKNNSIKQKKKDGAFISSMLEPEPRPPCASPLASSWRRCCYHRPYFFLPAAWHYGTKITYSEKGLQLERERQLTSARWLVIHPYSSFKFYWDLYIMTVYFVSLVYLPLQVFYPCCDPYDPYILFCDAMGFLWILINFITGRVGEDGKNVDLQLKWIAKKYVKDTFFLDVLSALPLQIIPLYSNCRFPTHTVTFLLKLFRLIPCVRVWKNLSEQFGISYVPTMATLTILRASMFFHWATFCHYQVPVFMTHTHERSLLFHKMLLRFKVIGHRNQDIWPLDKYVTNLYFVAGISIGTGVYTTEKTDHLPEEQLLGTTMSLIGLFFITYFFAMTEMLSSQMPLPWLMDFITILPFIAGIVYSIIRLIMYRYWGTLIYYGVSKELQSYLFFKRVPNRLCQKIQLYINYRFNGQYFNRPFILNTINLQIKQEINMHFCKSLVMNVPLFQDMPIALINTIIFSLTQVLYMPGEIIVKYGAPGCSIYLISAGTVAVMDADGNEVGHLKDGSFFGERALINPGMKRAATIIALEITEIYKLNHYQFRAALQPCPRLKRRLLNSSGDDPPMTHVSSEPSQTSSPNPDR